MTENFEITFFLRVPYIWAIQLTQIEKDLPEAFFVAC